ncbi:Hypothetical protein, putative [Bodo saltans]|uniref:Uncharacterized protein n=1 Tax=Bodo saltans TaxID=75058 RepID=A0A0S4JQM2_BODSA|nr:Hypothetical protein, putative [Bodo saltans]|eukprot:CUG92839.1 Hypothetical protein, putative [Bodo saltans]
MLEGVESIIGFVSISQGLYSQASNLCGGKVTIRLKNCNVRTMQMSAVAVPHAGRGGLDQCNLTLDVEALNTTFSVRNQRPIIEVNNPPSFVFSITITMMLLSCTVEFADTRSQILYILVDGTRVNSMIQLTDTVIVQQWTPFRNLFNTELAPASIIEVGSLRNSTIELISCNVTVVQKSTSTMFLQLPAALLLSVTKSTLDALITIRNSSFVVVTNTSRGSRFELHAPLLNLSNTGPPMRTAILVQDSTFINIESIVSRLVPAVNNNSQMTMIDGCGNRW